MSPRCVSMKRDQAQLLSLGNPAADREAGQGSKSTGSVYSARQPLLQHVELQRADDADDGRRAVDRGENSCTTPSSAICCSASFSFLAFIASPSGRGAGFPARSWARRGTGFPRPRSACRRCAACRGWGCRPRRRHRLRRRSMRSGRRRTAAPTALIGLPVRTSFAFMPRFSLPEQTRTKAMRSRWFGSMFAWILNTKAVIFRLRRLDGTRVSPSCARGGGAKSPSASIRSRTPKLRSAEPK
jgi:hypothetical protein